MIANWKSPTELPEKRIRVFICHKSGFMETGFYGRQSDSRGSDVECWRSDNRMDEDLNGFKFSYEREIPIEHIYGWDDFPEIPFPQKGPFDY